MLIVKPVHVVPLVVNLVPDMMPLMTAQTVAIR